MTLPTDYVDGDVLTAADVNAITTAVNGNIPASIIAAKGDLLVGLTNDSVGVLSVGTNGFLLSASSGATGGVAWVSSPSKVQKVATATLNTSASTTSGSFVDSGLELSFTPTNASNTLIISANFNGLLSGMTAAGLVVGEFEIFNSTSNTSLVIRRLEITFQTTTVEERTMGTPSQIVAVVSAGSTSARTYKLRLKKAAGTAAVEIPATSGVGLQAYMTIMEVEV